MLIYIIQYGHACDNTKLDEHDVKINTYKHSCVYHVKMLFKRNIGTLYMFLHYKDKLVCELFDYQFVNNTL